MTTEVEREIGRPADDTAAAALEGEAEKKCKPAPIDDDEFNSLIVAQRKAKKLAQISAEQGIGEATEAIYSNDPEKKKKRDEVVKTYEAEIATNPAGTVRTKFDAAMLMLKSALTDLHCKDDDSTPLAQWIGRQLSYHKDQRKICEPLDKPLYKLLFTRKQVEVRVDERLGKRERTLLDARKKSLRWANAFKAWSNPGQSIDDIIGNSVTDIEKINADIMAGRDVDHAIYRLLFEVAPRLLSVANDKLPDLADKAITRLSEALKDFPERQKKLVIGSKRGDGSVYLIAGDALQEHREYVLDIWTKLVDPQAAAEAESELRPDDAVELKKKLDALIQSEPFSKEALASPTS